VLSIVCLAALSEAAPMIGDYDFTPPVESATTVGTTAASNSSDVQQTIQQFPSAADILSQITFSCNEGGVQHSVGDKWVNKMSFMMECLPNGMIQETGCHSDGHDFLFSQQPTDIGKFRYWCCTNSKGAPSFQKVSVSDNTLGPGMVIRDSSGKLQFVPQAPAFCN